MDSPQEEIAMSAEQIANATMKGRRRVSMRGICVYGVRDGKIFREQFFYDLG